MWVTARAPTRIDLAGSSLDLYPLRLLVDGALTINLAISLHVTIHLSPGEPDAALPELLARPLRHLGLRYRVSSASDVPPRSGLGGSSALLLALLGALNAVAPPPPRSTAELCTLAAEIETQAVGPPTGLQDYYPAAFGGLQALWFGPGAVRTEPLASPLDLAGQLVLAYSGVAHDSPSINRNLVRAYIDDRGDARVRLRRIQANALAMRAAILDGDEEGFAAALREDWALRRRWMGSAPLTRLAARAERAGALAWKACGAGKGGCLVAWAPRERADAVRRALGASALAWAPDEVGLRVTVGTGPPPVAGAGADRRVRRRGGGGEGRRVEDA